jgi:Putative esterase
VSLLGWPLIVVLSTAVVATIIAALVLWARVRGPWAVRTAQRVVLLLLCQTSSLLLVAALANDYGYFYGSWSDLFGSSSSAGPAHVTRVEPQGHSAGQSAAPKATGAVVSTSTQGQWSTPAQWPTRGRVVKIAVRGPRTGLDAEVLVYLPPQYFQPGYEHHQFPAAEVLSGYPGYTPGLVNRLHYPDTLLAEISKGRAHPMVLVMLRPTVAPPRDTECTDVPGGPLALTYLAQDVPTAVDGLFRVRTSGWGAIGDSTGGYCAVKIAMTHSDVFSSAVSLSGYYHAVQDVTTGDLWGGSAVLRNLNSPEWLLAHQPAPPISVLLTMGLDEQGVYGMPDTRRFLALVRPPMTASTIFLPGGGHNFANWATMMPPALDWLSQRLGT